MDRTSLSIRCWLLLAVAASFTGAPREGLSAALSPAELAAEYRLRIDRRLDVPEEGARRHVRLTEGALQGAAADTSQAQWVFVVDRSPWVQASLRFWRSAAGDYTLAGASPVSTGRPGSFDHFPHRAPAAAPPAPAASPLSR